VLTCAVCISFGCVCMSTILHRYYTVALVRYVSSKLNVLLTYLLTYLYLSASGFTHVPIHQTTGLTGHWRVFDIVSSFRFCFWLRVLD